MSASTAAEHGLSYRIRLWIGMAIGAAICKPQMLLGRRRHDGNCDRCGEPIGRYAGEKLDFPLDDLAPDASSSIEKLRAMWDAEYVRVCLDCTAEQEGEDP